MNTIFNLEMIINYFKSTQLSVKLFCKIYNLNRDEFEKILIDNINISSQFLYDVSKALRVNLKDMFNKNYKFD